MHHFNYIVIFSHVRFHTHRITRFAGPAAMRAWDRHGDRHKDHLWHHKYSHMATPVPILHSAPRHQPGSAIIRP